MAVQITEVCSRFLYCLTYPMAFLSLTIAPSLVLWLQAGRDGTTAGTLGL